MKPKIVIITGLSGAGKTVTLRALEDSGFFSVDNLPPELIDRLVEVESGGAGITRFAVGIDIREKAFLSSLDASLTPLRKKYDIEVLFLEADPDVLLRRFKETRRPHPLGPSGIGSAEGLASPAEGAIGAEIKLLKPLRTSADRVLDTSAFTPHQLRSLISSLYGAKAANKAEKGAMSITLISFGYKFGIPQGADLLFDVRFLPNPHFVPELKDLKGTDEPVRDFVFRGPETLEFIEKITGLLDFLIPLYIREGKAYLTIGIGCTGGKHRSPAIVERVSSLFGEKSLKVEVVHRDL